MNNQRGSRSFRGRGAPRNIPNNRGGGGKPPNTRYFNQRNFGNISNSNRGRRDNDRRYESRDSNNSFRRNVNRGNSMSRNNNIRNDNMNPTFNDNTDNLNRSFDFLPDRPDFESGNERSSGFTSNQRNLNDNILSLEDMRRSPNPNRLSNYDNRFPENSNNMFQRNRNISDVDNRVPPNISLDNLFRVSRRNDTRNRSSDSNSQTKLNDNTQNDSRGLNKNDRSMSETRAFEGNPDHFNRQSRNLVENRSYFTDNFDNNRDGYDNSYANEDCNNSNQNYGRSPGYLSSGMGGRNVNAGRYFGPRVAENFIRPPAFFNKPVLGLNMGPPMNPADIRPKVFIPYNPVLRFARPSEEPELHSDLNINDAVGRNEENVESSTRYLGNVMESNPILLNNPRDRRCKRGRGNTIRKRGVDCRIRGGRRIETRSQSAGKFGKRQYSLENKRKSIKDKKKNDSIVIETTSDEDEDAVIEIPVTPPPLVLIEDDEENDVKECDDINVSLKNLAPNKNQGRNRAISPSSSIISDDFIVANDRQRVNSGSMSTPHDDDLQGQPTVESFVNKSRSKSREPEGDDISNFVPPVKFTEAFEKITHPCDKLEYELSDQSESIYDRSQKRRRDYSKMEDAITPKTSRMNKAGSLSKSSGFAASSDEGELIIDEKSIIDSSTDDDDTIAICPPPSIKSSTPFIKRGMALENSSNDDFATILSNIIEGKGNSSGDSDIIQLSDEENGNVSDDNETDVNKKLHEIDLTLNEEMNECDENLDKTQNEMPLVDEESSIGWNVSWGGDTLSTTINDRVSNMELPEKKSHNKSDTEIDYSNRPNRYDHLRCRNCNEKGHLKKHCKQPVKILCHMCGESGHTNGRCPNKVCLNCGNSANSFCKQCSNCKKALKSMCTLCKVKGHFAENCPDLWRRYHSTTTDNAKLSKKIAYSKLRHCSICTYKGHLAEHCKHAQRCLTWPVHSSRIFSHNPSYLVQETVDLSATEDVPSEPSSKRKSVEDFAPTIRKKIRINDEEFEVIEELAGDEEGKLPKEKSTKSPKLLINPFAKKSDKNKPASLNDFSFSREMEKLNESVASTSSQPFVLSFITDSMDETDETIGTKDDENKSNVSITETTDDVEMQTVEIVKENEYSNKLKELVEEDSNYSFSEFYDKNAKEKEALQSQNKDDIVIENDKASKVSSVSPVLDFISISNKGDNQTDLCQGHIQLNENTGNPELAEVSCTAKIYLSKEDSQIILSPSFANTMKSLVLTTKVGIQMKCQQTGYVLFIKGKPSEQDHFHKQLIEAVQNYKHDNRRKLLEQSLQVPKAKSVLIKFIDNNLDMLKINLGNVNSHYRKMIYNERNNSKQSIKMADKSRRVLNMILMGQYGLRDGKMHLTALQNIRQNLLSSDELHITTELRNAIFQHIKYIFSPFEHPNYETLVEEYHELKSNNKEITDETADIQPEPLVTTAKAVEIIKDVKKPSEYWSRKCEDVVEKCRKMLNTNDNKTVLNKLERVMSKAVENKLNNLDYQALMQIFNALKARNS